MKLLVISSTFPRWNDDAVPPFVLELCQHLSGFEKISVIAPHYPGAPTYEFMSGVEVIRYRYAPLQFEKLAYGSGIIQNIKSNPSLLLWLPGLIFFQIYTLITVLMKERYDVVHAHWLIPQGLCAAIAKKIIRKKFSLVVTAHGSDLALLGRKAWLGLLSWVLASTSALTVVGKHQALLLQELGFVGKRIYIMPMGVDTESTFLVPDLSNKKANRIIYVGRLIEQKGVVVLLNAVRRLKDDGIGVELVVVGDGPQRSALESLANKLGIDGSVCFKGWLNKSGVARELSDAALMVVPSLAPEGLGLVAIEGMASGCAVIASNFESFRDLLCNGESGILVSPGDVGGLAQAMAGLLNDVRLMKRFQERARDVVIKEYDWRVVARRYTDLFKELSGNANVCV